MSGPSVLVTDHNFGSLDVEERLLEGVAEVETLAVHSAADRERQFATADAVLTSRHRLDADRIETLEQCRVISRYGIGVDAVDVEAATARGIYVANAPTYGIEEVATHTTAMLLNLARQVGRADDVVAAGGWRSTPPAFSDPRAPDGSRALPVRRLSTQTVGFVGVGKIARAVADRLRGFDPRLVGFDPYVEASAVPDDVSLVEFGTVLAEADHLTIHTPLTEETRGLLDREAFERMKETAYLINCARGAIVDADALLDALAAGEIAGAALDVFAEEPLPADHPLRDHERVLTTPHIAYYSEEADVHRRRQAVENVQAALDDRRPPHAVNDP